MRGLDDIDREILSMLAADARTPYSDIADAVDRAPPTVSDRVDRLQELGVIRRFTVDLDRSTLDAGTPVLVELAVASDAVEAVRSALRGADAVERVYVTAGDRVLAHAHVPGDVRGFLDRVLPDEGVRSRDVSLLSESESAPGVGDVSLALSCAECENTVTAEGESRTLDGDTYYFCCSSCEERFVERYESFADATNA
ncbi:winged helix-turn-helix transcriptional regulator [Salarchaeum japonicum]|uniref:AsnC family transcriptional regulator n=1 Tax=Salarchaeum japonicum TaxID=555573 RepID=A0AAV3T251_9EURY|nr:winged helix-turn-helix transcriptional regulator [Salarchaeum japonicum]